MSDLRTGYKIKHKTTGEYLFAVRRTRKHWREATKKIIWNEQGRVFARYATVLNNIHRIFEEDGFDLQDNITLSDIEIIELKIVIDETTFNQTKFETDLENLKKELFLTSKLTGRFRTNTLVNLVHAQSLGFSYMMFWGNTVGKERFDEIIQILFDSGLKQEEHFEFDRPFIVFKDKSYISLVMLTYDQKRYDKIYTLNTDDYVNGTFKQFKDSFNNV